MRKERRKREKRVKKKKNENKESGDKVLIIKTKSYLAREAEKEIPSVPVKKVSYPMVPSKKENEQYFTGFLDIFKKLKITIPFGETLQQMSLYTKFLKDLLTKKGKYINNESIIVEGNYSASRGSYHTSSKVQEA